jgi:hypothetical protein
VRQRYVHGRLGHSKYIEMYHRPHHKVIHHLLTQFNSSFLEANNILFGGGTRIALELGEYRESVDIDFLCPNTESYRAVRSEILSHSLGNLISGQVTLAREVMPNRYAVRTALEFQGTRVKLEFVAFDDYKIHSTVNSPFPIPCIDPDSCYITKLLAHADRHVEPVRKDFIDLLMMFQHWGPPSESVWTEVERHYGHSARITLVKKLDEFIQDQSFIFNNCKNMDMDINKHGASMLDSATRWQALMLSTDHDEHPPSNFSP